MLIAVSNLPWDTCIARGCGPDLDATARTHLTTDDKVAGFLARCDSADIEMEDVGGSPTNVAVAWSALGGEAAVVGPIGRDAYGRRTREALERHELRLLEITPSPDRQAHSLAVMQDFGERRFLATLPILTAEARAPAVDWAGIQWIVSSAYELRTPEMRRIVRECFQEARRAKSRTAFDLADRHFVAENRNIVQEFLADGIDVLLSGPEALAALARVPVEGLTPEALQSLASVVLVTDGSRGVRVIHEGIEDSEAAVPSRVVDSTGAGDAFFGAFLYDWTETRDVRRAVRFGLAAAAEKISTPGAHLPATEWENLRRR